MDDLMENVMHAEMKGCPKVKQRKKGEFEEQKENCFRKYACVCGGVLKHTNLPKGALQVALQAANLL